jgi:hypothetical protein
MTVSTLPPLPSAPIPSEYIYTYAPTVAPLACAPTLPTDILVGLFGGGSFRLPLIPRVPDPLELLGRGLQGLNGQLSPMAPVVTVLNATAALVAFVKNLPSNVAAAIAFNPKPLIDSVTAVVSAATDVVALAILPLQFAKMARGFVQMLRDYLVTLKAQIAAIITRYTDLNALIAQAQALGIASLVTNATCARNRLDTKVSAINAVLASLGVMIALFQVIICFVTGGEVSILVPTLNASALSGAIFDPVIAVLDALLAAIPDLSGLQLAC